MSVFYWIINSHMTGYLVVSDNPDIPTLVDNPIVYPTAPILFQQRYDNSIISIDNTYPYLCFNWGLGLWCISPLPTIVQLHRGGQFY
jgi:hypothetical protein